MRDEQLLEYLRTPVLQEEPCRRGGVGANTPRQRDRPDGLAYADPPYVKTE